jgi:SAM-dependent methyltransferase
MLASIHKYFEWFNTRRSKVLRHININGNGLEIGGGYMPIFRKDQGYNVKTLDYVSADEIKQIYKEQAVNTSGIEEVDFIWKGGPYTDLVKGETFDWVVASNVIEHVPDFIGFINECTSILKDNGVLVLFVPDRRYSLDYFRSTSSLGSIIDAHLLNRKCPSPGNILDALFLETTPYRHSNNPYDKDITFLENPNITAYNKTVAFDGYKDIHVWVFTPGHFRIVIEDLYLCGAIKLREKKFYPTDERDFCIFLSKDGSGPGLSRIDLAKNIVKERKVNILKAGRGANFLKNVFPEIDKRYLHGIIGKCEGLIRHLF